MIKKLLFNKINWILFFIFSSIYMYMLMMKLSNLYWMNGEIFINSWFSLNKYSPLLLLLILWMFMIMILLNNNNEINFMLLILSVILFMSFISKNLILFFFFFEFSLIPIFYIVKKLGLYMNRMSASFYLLFYTLFFSFPMFYILMSFLKNFYSMEYMYLLMKYIYLNLNFIEFTFLIMGFLVKMPMFLLHFWLPKAHVEAPVYGSMYLASIMLKLGSYGLIRFMNFINFNDKNLFMSISMIGMLIISMNCLRIIDMKIIVAYSSVIHMNMMISAIFTYSMTGFMGSYMMMIAHGLISSGMFYMINEFYLNSKSRLFNFNKGILNLIPMNQMMWFFLCTSNLGVPMSLNFISEIFMLMSIITYNWKLLMLLLFFIIMFNSFYNLYLYMYIAHSNKINNKKILNFNMNNFFIILMHWIPINLIFFKMNMFYI